MSWDRIATEGQTVSVAAGTAVRYGVSATERFFERVVSGPVTANNATFGDPAVGVVKGLFAMTTIAAPAPPAPAPAPPAPSPAPIPTVQSLSDPRFLEKMGLLLDAQKATALSFLEPTRRERIWELVAKMMTSSLTPSTVVAKAIATVDEFERRVPPAA